MKTTFRTLLGATTLSALVAASPPGLAGEPKSAPALPGVDGKYSIVTPAPEPDEAAPASSGTTKVGKWELTVSGYVWVQVGASSARSK